MFHIYNKFLFMLVFIVLLVSAQQGYGQEKRILFKSNFSRKSDLKQWKGRRNGKVIKLDDTNEVLRIKSTNAAKKKWLIYDLPMNEVRGATVQIKARYKGINISTPAANYLGVKMMVRYSTPYTQAWPQSYGPSGTFDWRDGLLQVIIPFNATSANIVIGLENVSGELLVDDLEVSIVKPARTSQAAIVTAAPVYKGHSLPRLRGAMVNPRATKEDMETLASWGANHIRWQLMWGGFPLSEADTASVESYRKWLAGALNYMDSMLPVCRRLGLRVVLDLHTLPGGRSQRDSVRLFREKRFQDEFVQIWREMANRYKDESAIWAYDLANEPFGTVAEGLMDWQQLSTVAAYEIRKIDTTHAIIVEAAPGGGVYPMAQMHPIPVPKVVYSFHMYEPESFTHQGVFSPSEPVFYPGFINGRVWNRETLRELLSTVVKWQKDYNAHIYVGEFSAIRWAPGARQYLSDLIELFEEFGWDWSYHAFREWSGWSVEHDADRSNENPASMPTDRQQLLMQWYGKNKK